MHRNLLLKMLSDYNSALEKEQIFKNQIVDFVNENENCFERTLDSGHITASAWLVNSHNNKALLTHHMKLDKWFQFGGHCDGHSNVLEAAIREAQEESGIMDIFPVSEEIFDLDVHLIPANSKEKAHYHYDIRFLLQVRGDDTFKISNESKELRWIGKDKNDLLLEEDSVNRLFKKWVEFSCVS